MRVGKKAYLNGKFQEKETGENGQKGNRLI